MKRAAWVLGVVVVAVAMAWVFNRGSVPAGRGGGAATLPPGGSSSGLKEAPDFQLKTLDGQMLQLSALKGKVVLLDFWATWCPPCKAEIPHFKELYTGYKDRGLEIIGASLDEGGEGPVKAFVQQNGVTYPVGLADSRLAQAYGGIQGIPTTFLIDREGKIAKKYIGYQDKEVFEKEIRRLLSSE